MKKVLLVMAIMLLAGVARGQTFYAVDSSYHVGSLLTNTVGSVQAPPYWLHVSTGTGGYFARIGVPLLVVLRDTTNDSSFYQKFELDSVSAIVGDSLYVVKRALSNSLRYGWSAGTRVEAVANDGVIIDQLQDAVNGIIGLPDTTGKAGKWLIDSAGGIGPRWATLTSSGGGVTSFNARTGVVTPASGDYAFNQLNGTAAVTQGGTGLTSILSQKLIYASANNVFSPLTLGAGLSITSDTMMVSGFAPAFPDSTGYTSNTLTVLPGGGYGWTAPGTGTLTSISASGGASGLTLTPGPFVRTGTISITGGQLAVAYGGTGGATKEQAQINILPDTATKTNKYLRVSAAGGIVWDTAVGSGGGGSGTVTNVSTSLSGISIANPTTTPAISGTLGISSGGTALTSTPTNGQLLIGKTSTNAYVLATLTGTTSELVVTNGGGTITLSTPQPIATTSDVTFDSLTLTKPLPVTDGGSGGTTFTGNSLLLGNGTSPFTALGAATDGQIPIGYTGAAPSLATITGTSNQVIVTNGHGSITLSTPQSIATTSSPTFAGLTLTSPLTYANGGTGQSSYAKGDIIYASAANTLSKLAIGTAGYLLTVSGGVPSWAPIGTAVDSVRASHIADTAKVVSHLDVLDSTIRSATTALADSSKKAPVMSVSNSDGTLTISPTTGVVVASLAPAHTNTWTGLVIQNQAGITAIDTEAFEANNTTVSTLSIKVQDPGVYETSGHVWGNGADSTITWRLGNKLITGGTPKSEFEFEVGNTGAGFTIPMELSNAGLLNILSTYDINGTAVLSSTQVLGGPNVTAAPASDPTGTSSATTKMMGLGGTITPTKSGTVTFTVTCNIDPGATGSPTAQIYYGTGSAPTNGQAVTGTGIGSIATVTGLANGSDCVSLTGTAVGLMPNTAYWFDIGLASDGTSTASIKSVYLQAIEIK